MTLSAYMDFSTSNPISVLFQFILQNNKKLHIKNSNPKFNLIINLSLFKYKKIFFSFKIVIYI